MASLPTAIPRSPPKPPVPVSPAGAVDDDEGADGKVTTLHPGDKGDRSGCARCCRSPGGHGSRPNSRGDGAAPPVHRCKLGTPQGGDRSRGNLGTQGQRGQQGRGRSHGYPRKGLNPARGVQTPSLESQRGDSPLQPAARRVTSLEVTAPVGNPAGSGVPGTPRCCSPPQGWVSSPPAGTGLTSVVPCSVPDEQPAGPAPAPWLPAPASARR